jgi:hypothetical protein
VSRQILDRQIVADAAGMANEARATVSIPFRGFFGDDEKGLSEIRSRWFQSPSEDSSVMTVSLLSSLGKRGFKKVFTPPLPFCFPKKFFASESAIFRV